MEIIRSIRHVLAFANQDPNQGLLDQGCMSFLYGDHRGGFIHLLDMSFCKLCRA